MSRCWRRLAILACVLAVTGCGRQQTPSGFRVVRADRQIAGTSAYPLAVASSLVGTYPVDTRSGAGYFYDDVLEYRVWLHPDKGAAPLNGEKDYFVAFAQYEPAEAFSRKTAGAEAPLALVRQFEWIDEPQRGQFVPEKGERITEWQVQWLLDNKRGANSIAEFMKHPKEEGP